MNPLTKAFLCSIAMLPAAHAAALTLGDTSGNSRGSDAVDVQAKRSASNQVASGQESVALGHNNKALGDFSSAIGRWNVSDSESLAVGLYNTTVGYYGVAIGVENQAAAESLSVGLLNEVTGLGYAFGFSNVISAGAVLSSPYSPSAAIGESNTISGTNGYAIGKTNTITAANAYVFGASITNATASSLMIGPSDAAKVTILSSGNVGIGTGTASPTEKLHVVGNLKVTGNIITGSGATPSITTSGSGSTSRMLIGGTSSPTSAWQGALVAGPDGQSKVLTGYLTSGIYGATIGANNSALNAWADLNFVGSNLIFRTPSQSTEAERMRIDSNGNVGIGTASPQATLQIQAPNVVDGAKALRVVDPSFPATAANSSSGALGQVHFSPVANNAAVVSLGRRGTTVANSGTELGTLLFNGSGGDGASFRKAATLTAISKTSNWGNDNASSDLAISVNAGTSQMADMTEVMRIASNKSVGIGTSSPAAKLDVNGTVQIAGTVQLASDVKVKNKAVIRISAAGDIGMGSFTSGTDPEL